MVKGKKKKDLPKDNPSLEVIENTVKHIKEKVDEFCDQMKSVEKNLVQVSLNKQSINTLKNNVKNINDVRVPKIKKDLKEEVDDINEKLDKKVSTKIFGLILFAFTVINGIAAYIQVIY